MNKFNVFLLFILASKHIFCEENLFDFKEDTIFLSFEQNIETIQTDDYMLDYLQQNPVDLNTATYDKLKMIPYLKEDEIIEILTKKEFMTNNQSSYYFTTKLSSKKLTGKVDLRISNDFENLNSFYFFNRTQLFCKDKISFGYEFLRRQDEVGVDIDSFKNFFRKWWLKFPIKSTTFIVGNYKANFGTGMVFSKNYPMGNFIRNIKPLPSGLEEDKSIYDNAYLYGFGIEKLSKNFLFSLFYSNKNLLKVNISTNSFGSFVNEDLIEVRKEEVSYSTNQQINSVNEELVGFNLKAIFKKFKIGSCGYYSWYNILFDPDKTNTFGYKLLDKYSERWRYVFRGNRLFLVSLYCEVPFEKMSLFLETAQSYSKTSDTRYSNTDYGVNLGVTFKTKNIGSYLTYVYLGNYFYSPLGQPILIYDYPNSQTGVKLLNEFKYGKFNFILSLTCGRILSGIWSGYYSSEQPKYPFNYNDSYIKIFCKLSRNITFSLYSFYSLYECYINLKNYNLSFFDEYIQTTQFKFKNAYKITYNILEPLKLSLCYDKKLREFPDFKKQLYGEQLFSEIQYKISKLNCFFRFSIFNADKGVYLTYLKPQWRNFYIFEYDDASFGDKLYLSFAYNILNNLDIWFGYENKNYVNFESKYVDIIKFQIELVF